MSDMTWPADNSTEMHPSDVRQIDAWIAHLHHTGHPTTTINTYRTPLLRAAAELPYGLQATGDELEAWVGRLRGQLAPNTVAAYTTALRRFYHWCWRTDRLGRDLADDIPAARQERGLPRPVPDDQLAILLGHARQPYRMWAIIAVHAGLRCAELAGLHREDVTEQSIHVRRGKGGKPRVIPTHPQVWQIVRMLPPGPICGGCTPKRVSANINKECDRLGIPDVVAHMLRHSFGTSAYEASGGDIRAVQQAMGHTSPTVTALYTLVSDQAMSAAVNGLSFPTGASADAATGTAAAGSRMPARHAA